MIIFIDTNAYPTKAMFPYKRLRNLSLRQQKCLDVVRVPKVYTNNSYKSKKTQKGQTSA